MGMRQATNMICECIGWIVLRLHVKGRGDAGFGSEPSTGRLKDPNPTLKIVRRRAACDASGDPNLSRVSLTRDIEILQLEHDITHLDTTLQDFYE